jgi:hypothetical protein
VVNADCSRERVLALLPRGEAIRNFVYSGVLSTLQREVDVSVASVVPDESVRQSLEAAFGPIIELGEDKPPWRVAIWHELLDAAHGRWIWSEAAKERWRLRELEADTPSAILKLRGKRAVARAAARPIGLRTLERAHLATSARWHVTDADRDVIARLAPALVFNGSQVHGRAANRLLMAAKSLGVPTAAFVFSWDNLTSQGRIVPPADAYLVWNEKIRTDLLQMYPSVDPASVMVTGTPQFDFHFRGDTRWSRETYCARVGIDPLRPIVLYSTGMPNHMPGEPALVEQLADALSTLEDHPQLVVRLYAKDRSGRFDDVRSRRRDIVFPPVAWAESWLTPLPDDTAMWTNMLLHADVGINVASTVSLELAMFDKPVLNIAFNPAGIPTSELEYARYYRFDHYAPVVASGAVELITTPDGVAPAVRRALDEPAQRQAERTALLDKMFGATLDGRSSDRVAAALVELAHRFGRGARHR